MDNKQLVIKEQQTAMGIFDTVDKFEGALRMANALAKSTLVPKEYQNNISNCLIAIDVATRLKLSPFATMQNLYVVHGRPSWSSQFIIGAINRCSRFAEPLKFNLTGSGDSLECYAYTKDHFGNVLKGATVTMKMAKIEGWVDKNGSKWKTMPEVMIQYRSASFFGRLHCPDILMGVYTDDENVERGDNNKSINHIQHEIQTTIATESIPQIDCVESTPIPSSVPSDVPSAIPVDATNDISVDDAQIVMPNF